MTEQAYNTASGMPSGPQTPFFSFPSVLTLPQQHLQAVAAGIAVSHEEIINSIFNFVGATRFLGNIISIRKLKTDKETGSSSNPNGDTAIRMSYSIILRFKSVPVRNEVMKLKIVKGNIPVVTIFRDLSDLTENKIFLSEFLAKEVLKLLILVRARAKAHNYETVWVETSRSLSEKAPIPT